MKYVLPLAETVAKFENLKRLSFRGPCLGDYKNYLENTFPIFFKNSTRLKYLRIVAPVTTDMLIQLSKLAPRLEYLYIESFPTLNSNPELFKILVNLNNLFPHLKEHNLLHNMCDEERAFLALRDVSRKLQDMNTSSRLLYEDLHSLDEQTLQVLKFDYLYLYVPWDSTLTHTILSKDVDRMLTFTKPLASFLGSNLLEQVAWIKYQKCSRIFTEVFKAVALGNDKLYPFNAPTALTKKLQVAIWKRNGKMGAPSEHFDRLFAADRNPADVYTALAAIHKEYKLTKRPFSRESLEHLLFCLRDEELKPKQFCFIFTHLDSSLRVRLKAACASHGWAITSSVNDKIWKDTRVLQDVVERMIRDLSTVEQLTELLACINSEMKQPELLEEFENLDQDLQTKLSYYLWKSSREPDEESVVADMIRKDVRCLSPHISAIPNVTQ